MPTNHQRPEWTCDVCGRNFKEDYDAAVACEAEPIGYRPPIGTPVLRGNFHGLHIATIDNIRDHPDAGAHDTFGMTLSDVQGMSRWINTKRFNWAPPGFLTVDPGSFRAAAHNSRMSWHNESDLDLDFIALFGMAPPGDHKYNFYAKDVIGPLPPAVRILLEELELTPVIPEDRWRMRPSTDGRLAALSLIDTGFDEIRAEVLYRTNPPTVRRLIDDTARWWDGEDVCIPMPSWRSTRWHRNDSVTPSKLLKAHKQALQNYGIEWEPRYNQDEFARKLFRREDLLMSTKMVRTRLPIPTVALASAKGGVGKSTLTAAYAIALANTGKKVLILDCDTRNRSQQVLWNPGPVAIDEEHRILPSEVRENIFVFGPGQLTSEGDPGEWHDGIMGDFIKFIAHNAELDGFDVALLDLPGGDSSILKRVISSSSPLADMLVIVASGHTLIADATARWLPTLHGLHDSTRCGQRQVIVENLSHLPGGKRVLGSDETIQKLAEPNGLECAGYFPIAENHIILSEDVPAELLALTPLRTIKTDQYESDDEELDDDE